MKRAISPFALIKLGLAVVVLAAFTGCVGYVDGGYGGTVIVPGPPDVVFWGGGYERGRYVHDYGHRGYESRGSVHSGGGPVRIPLPPLPGVGGRGNKR